DGGVGAAAVLLQLLDDRLGHLVQVHRWAVLLASHAGMVTVDEPDGQSRIDAERKGFRCNHVSVRRFRLSGASGVGKITRATHSEESVMSPDRSAFESLRHAAGG